MNEWIAGFFISLMTTFNWTSLASFLTVGSILYFSLRSLTKGVLSLRDAWRAAIPEVPDLVKEVREIRQLLQEGAAWMRLHDQRETQTEQRVGALETGHVDVVQRVAKLEGITL